MKRSAKVSNPQGEKEMVLVQLWATAGVVAEGGAAAATTAVYAASGWL
jgi:hypothetical protein